MRRDPAADNLEAFRQQLETRLAQLHRMSQDEQLRAAALSEIAQEIRNRSLHVRSCAWCGRISVGNGWYPPSVSELVERLSKTRTETHGICPVCFGQMAPGEHYPE